MKQEGLVARRAAAARRELAGLRRDRATRRQFWGLLGMAGLGLAGLLMVVGGARMLWAGRGAAAVATLALGTCMLLAMSVLFYRSEFSGRGWKGIASFIAILLASVLAGQLATGTLFRVLFHR